MEVQRFLVGLKFAPVFGTQLLTAYLMLSICASQQRFAIALMQGFLAILASDLSLEYTSTV
jgi:hypothetical protein